MQHIIDPIDKKLLKAELTPDKLLSKTITGHNEIYVADCNNSPNLLREIGRLREITFRAAGGGTGKDCDLDEFDLDEHNPFRQLFVWNPRDEEIIGGYRYIHGKTLKTNALGKIDTPTTELFQLSDSFIRNYLPHTIELGRSFVQPAYQPTINLRKGIYALDNIWNGLGVLLLSNPDVRFYFGKITMYPHFNAEARDFILFFLKKYFFDKNDLVKPHIPFLISTDEGYIDSHFTGGTFETDYKILNREVRSRGENIPPLVNAYTNLSSTMLYFGTALNPGFGDVQESGILITIDDIRGEKKARHMKKH